MRTFTDNQLVILLTIVLMGGIVIGMIIQRFSEAKARVGRDEERGQGFFEFQLYYLISQAVKARYQLRIDGVPEGKLRMGGTVMVPSVRPMTDYRRELEEKARMLEENKLQE